jgi:hypothetical protein
MTHRDPAASGTPIRRSTRLDECHTALHDCLRIAFRNPDTAWKKIDTFHARHGLEALLSELSKEGRQRFGRAPARWTGQKLVQGEAQAVRFEAEMARQRIPELLAAYYDAFALTRAGE